jgi:hypothetical protein
MTLHNVLGSLALTVSLCNLLSGAGDWPTIQPVHDDKVIRHIADTDSPLTIWIKSAVGKPVYKLECHTGNYENESEMNFSGEYQCALFAIKDGELASGNLLAADTKDELSTDWWNRGRIRADQLRGACLEYSDYSTDRRFLLRGMRVTLHVYDPQWAQTSKSHLLTGFTFGITIVPDPHANSARPEVPPGPKPPNACYP